MAPNSPPPRDDEVTAWDRRRGVFLVKDAPRPSKPQKTSLAERILLLGGVALWCWIFLRPPVVLLWEALR